MDDITRIILTLLVNDNIETMQGHVADFLNGEYDEPLEHTRDALASLQEYVQEHIDYRADMEARADIDERFMRSTEPVPAPYGAPENDIMAAMQSFDHDL